MAAITRRCHTINATTQEAGDELHITGKVSVSNQVIGPDRWWILSDCPDTETVPLTPVGHLYSTYVDVDGTEVDLDLSNLGSTMNPLFDELERLSAKKPTKVVDFESGQQKQWHLPADKFIKYSSTRSFVIRPMLFQNPSDSEQHQKLLISIHSLFVPPTTKKCRW